MVWKRRRKEYVRSRVSSERNTVVTTARVKLTFGFPVHLSLFGHRHQRR
jgi:hypothetical protein